MNQQAENLYQNCSEVLTNDSPRRNNTQTTQPNPTEAKTVSVAISASVEQMPHMSLDQARDLNGNAWKPITPEKYWNILKN